MSFLDKLVEFCIEPTPPEVLKRQEEKRVKKRYKKLKKQTEKQLKEIEKRYEKL
jgi:hypothetical protein